LIELMVRPEAVAGVVVAWVEPGEANLEFDARRARPRAGSIYGVAPSETDGVEIRLDRRVRAA